MHPLLSSIAQVEPIWADMAGGMDRLPNFAEMTLKIRTAINQQELRKVITRDASVDFAVMNGGEAERVLQTVSPRTNFKFEFSALESRNTSQMCPSLKVFSTWRKSSS